MNRLLHLFAIFGLIALGLSEVLDLLRLNELEKIEYRETLNGCYKDTGTTAEDLNAFENGISAPKENLGCLLACFAQRIGVLKDDGAYDASVFVEKLSPVNFEVVQECFRQAPVGDLCYQSLHAYTCYITTAQKDEPRVLFPLEYFYRYYK